MSHTDDDARYRKNAGTVLWPSTPDLLTDSTKCPACFTPLTDIVCRHCGLHLGHPAAHELASLSQSASQALSQRIDVIGRIRYETSEPPAVAAAAPTHASMPAAAGPEAAVTHAPPVAPVSHPPVAATEVAPPPPTPSSPADGQAASAGPRRSGVQVALLIAAVSLLSVFAIFFLVYAFINYGLVWRSVIIAAITVAAFVSASLLRRKNLGTSAEGLAVFAIVLVYLDAYALRANDFFGLEAADGASYWGATITIASVGFIAWHRLAGMRAASLVGWSGLLVGVGTLAWGLGDTAAPATRAFVAVAAAALVGLTQVLVPRSSAAGPSSAGPSSAGPNFVGALERIVVLCLTVVALVAAYLAAWVVEPLSDFGGAVAMTVVVVIAFAHAAAAAVGRASRSAVRAFGNVFATIGGVSAASAATAAGVRLTYDDSSFAIFIPAVSAATVAVLLEVAAHRLPSSWLRRPAVFAAWGATVVLVVTVLSPLVAALSPIGLGLLDAMLNPLTGGAEVGLALDRPTSDVAVFTLACVVALAASIWLLTGALQRRSTAIAWGSSLVLVLAAAQLPTAWMTLTAWFLLAAIAFVLLVRAALSPGLRGCLFTVLATTTTLAYVLGWASRDTWAAASIATIAVLVASRALSRASAARATLLGTATVVSLVAVAAAAHHFAAPATPANAIDYLNAASLLAITGPVLIAASAIGYRRQVTALDRRTVFWISGVASGGAALLALNIVADLAAYDASALLLPQPLSSLISSILLFGALLLWPALAANARLRVERTAASVALGPAALWMVDSFARVLDLPDFAQSVVPITAALLTTAGALALSLLRPSGTPRWAREAGAALVGVPAIAWAVGAEAESGWLVLVLGAIGMLLASISVDGLFSSGSRRRHLGSAALALATSGLWWRLSSDSVEALEPYVLPLAAALLVIGTLIHRSAARATAAMPSKAASMVALGGLLIGIVPLAANSITGDPVRAYILFAVSAVLAVAGSLMVRRAAQRYLDVIALAGVLGIVITAGGRALLLPSDNLIPDAWVAAALAVLLVAAFAQARRRDDENERVRAVVSQALVGTGLLVFAGIQSEGYADSNLGLIRAISTIGLLSAFHVVAFAINSAPLTRLVALGSIALAGGAAVVGLATEALDVVELGTVPIAIALLVTGRIELSAEPERSSWRALGLALVVLLVPSLLATMSDPELWRLVGLGIVSVVVLIVGAVRRLQAPFLLGLGVALIHGFATFAPQIRAVYESQAWWVWAGLAGIVLLLLAIRYEKRIQNLKDAVGRIAALR